MKNTVVLQQELPFAPWMDSQASRLPGIMPMAAGDWLRVDDAYAGQMALRDRLIAERRDAVHALLPEGRMAANELLERVLTELRGMAEFTVGAGSVTRPDGIVVPLDPDAPLLTLGRLVQEDLCLMQKIGDQHVLTGAILCFPASWSLDEKIGRPLTGIHVPVPQYDSNLAVRVQRMFDRVRLDQPLWRANALRYGDAILHHPRREADPRERRADAPYVRSERQCLVRLAQSDAVVFSIHTYLVHDSSLSQDLRAALDQHLGAAQAPA